MKKRIVSFLTLIIMLVVISVPVQASSNTSNIQNGIIEFQRYINTNLPPQYLGNNLALDGSCGNLTKTAAIKLIQYYLNQDGANLTVDGGFGPLTQNAFESVVGSIQRLQYGKWVYILQGLLYCHGYDPQGIDGSYGVSGGRGCLFAVNQFKYDNWIYEDVAHEEENGVVGINTMKYLTWRMSNSTISDGLFYIKNAYSNMYLTDFGDANHNLVQHSKYSVINNKSQLFKITYVGNGIYSVRSMKNLSLAMCSYVSGNIGLYDLGLKDRLSIVQGGTPWTITKDSSDFYTFTLYGYSNDVLTISGNSTAENANVCTQANNGETRFKWVLEKKEANAVPIKAYYDKSFYDIHLNSSQLAVYHIYIDAWYPFKAFMNYSSSLQISRPSYILQSDECRRGSYNSEISNCCALANHSSNYGVYCDQCKCIVRLLNTIDAHDSDFYGLKNCMFNFTTCCNIAGLAYPNGKTAVFKPLSTIDQTNSDYLYRTRVIQHELSHNFGASHTNPAANDECTSRCIMNSGLDFLRDFNVKCIWCNRCLQSVNINKFS